MVLDSEINTGTLEEYLLDKPDYIDILRRVVEWEEDNLDPEHPLIQGKPYDVCWTYDDISAHPSKLYQLEVNGFLERVFDSQSTTAYALKDRDKTKQILNKIENTTGSDGERIVMHEFPTEEELEKMGVFDDVVGYDDVKFLMRRAMSSEKITNIVMFGPPGSAKTVFLMCINKLEDACYISGKPTSGPGFFDKMFDEEPRYMAIDELDNMKTEDQKALSDYTDNGILVETKGNNKRRQMQTNTKTFAAANRSGDILDEIENRFVDLHFEPYTYEEFIEVCEHILPKNEGKSKEEARQIAEAVWDFDGFGNVRKAIQASRLSKGDPEKVIGVLDSYSPSGGLLG